MKFSEKYAAIKKLVEDELEELRSEILKELDEKTELNKGIKEFFRLPSKHIRAVVSFLYLKSIGIPINKKQITIQTVIELVHNASLIHDDVIDDCSERRGDKSFNAGFGSRLSVIAGDYILSFALTKLAELNSSDILKLFARTLNNMCKGEIDQHFSKFKIPSIEEYIEKTYNKTGALFETALSSALTAAEMGNYKNDFAKNFGIAFQIRDDILNVTQNRQDSDIKNGIYTAMVIYSANPDKPHEGIEKAKILLDNYVRKAAELIKDLPENKYKTALKELLELINNV